MAESNAIARYWGFLGLALSAVNLDSPRAAVDRGPLDQEISSPAGCIDPTVGGAGDVRSGTLSW